MVPLFLRQNDLFLSLPARTTDKTGLDVLLKFMKSFPSGFLS